MGKAFEKGVGWYTKGTAVVETNFPEDDVCCKWCRFCLRDRYDNSRQICNITGEMLYAPLYTVGEGCPLAIEEE